MPSCTSNTPPQTATQQSTYTPPDLVSYEVSGAVATQPAPGVMVVRYYVVANETLHGRQLSAARRPRLTVFARGAVGGTEGDSGWRLVRWAPLGRALGSAGAEAGPARGPVRLF
jgi:hypothetical protein